MKRLHTDNFLELSKSSDTTIPLSQRKLVNARAICRMAAGSRNVTASAAAFISIADLLATSDPSQYGLVRVIGKLERYDIKNSIVWIQDHKMPTLQVAISASNIEPVPFASRMGTLYQFIGEVKYGDVPTGDGESERGAVMTALAHRCMDGLDMDIYITAHQARMRELKAPVVAPVTQTDTSELMMTGDS